MSKRRSAIFANKRCIVKPLSNTCQVCDITAAINSCKICNRIICFKDTFYCNKNTYCKICYFDKEVNGLIVIDHFEGEKVTCIRKIKEGLKYSFSFEWLYH